MLAPSKICTAPIRLEAYIPLIHKVAKPIRYRLPKCVEYDDLIQWGFFGLKDAAERYDPSRGIKFESFASLRIYGAIMDGIRDSDWVPRLTRKRSSIISKAQRTLSARLDREPTIAEMAEHLKVSVSEFEKMRNDSSPVGTSSLSTEAGNIDRPIDMVDDRGRYGIEDIEARDSFDALIRRLSRIQRHIVTEYYRNEKTMREIGEELKMSESRVSQIHSAAIRLMKIPNGRPMNDETPITVIPRDILCKQMMDQKFTLPGAARTAGVTVDELEAAIKTGEPVGRHGLIFSRDDADVSPPPCEQSETVRRRRKATVPVWCVELKRSFISASDAARQAKSYPANISAAARSGKVAGGYHWELYDPSKHGPAMGECGPATKRIVEAKPEQLPSTDSLIKALRQKILAKMEAEIEQVKAKYADALSRVEALRGMDV